MRLFLLAIFTQLIQYQGFSQFFDDARGLALGSATVAAPADFSAFSNAAGLAFLAKKSRSATAAAAMPFSQTAWKKLGLAAAFPAGETGHFSLAVSKNGLPDFSQNEARLAYGRKIFQHVGLGAAVDFSTFRSSETEPRSGLTVGLGMLAQASKSLVLGFFVQNPLQNRRFDGSAMPVGLRLGAAFRLSAESLLTAEIEKNLLSPPVIKAGAERVFSEKFTARAGMRTAPLRFSGGGRLGLGRGISMDFAAESHPVLGLTPAVGFLKKWN